MWIHTFQSSDVFQTPFVVISHPNLNGCGAVLRFHTFQSGNGKEGGINYTIIKFAKTSLDISSKVVSLTP
jgi:hypothetical protein